MTMSRCSSANQGGSSNRSKNGSKIRNEKANEQRQKEE
jgi:hypothetical protein